MKFLTDRTFIVKQFRAMGASVPQIIQETIRLFSDKSYFQDWQRVITK